MTIAGVFATLSLMMAPAADQPTVRIQQGVLIGRADADVAAFKNIPYAAPPTAERRWRPPGAAPTWQGQRDAGAYGPLCI
ncbi:MAG: carboxylesterase, partial [Caulobacteraceae bacterium]